MQHFTSWLTLAPRNKISGGRLLSSRTAPSANRAAAIFRLAAVNVGRMQTALGAFYRRLAYRVLLPANTVERNGFAETRLSMHSHTGTHVDAPAHMLAGGLTLRDLAADRFVGRACAIDVSAAAPIEASALEAHADLVAGCDFVLLRTGWSRFWADDRYFAAYPVLAQEAARWLAARGLKGVGVDAISADRIDATVFTNHLAFFQAGMVIVENLTGLDALVGRRFLFSCLPLKLDTDDGSPVRAVAIVE